MLKKVTALTIFIALLSLTVVGYAQTGTFSGTVSDEGGDPLEGATVSLHSGWGWGGNWYCTETLEDGTFIIEDVEVDEYTASAFAWGYMWDSETVEILENQTTTVDFVLESWGGGGGGPTGTCSGTVTDEVGDPIEGATVTLHSGWGWGGNNYSTETLEDGTYIIEDVEVGEYTASAFAWGYGWDSQTVEILEGQTTTADFVLESWGGGGPTGICSGTVTDEVGDPIEGAYISMHSDGWGWGGNWYSTQTLEDGTYIIEDVEVGEYTITAFAWGYEMDSQTVEILEGETAIVDFVLQSWGGGGGATGTFSGTVTDNAGEPIEDASVSLHPQNGWGWGWWGWGNWYWTQTLEDGSFIIEDVEVGDYVASAFAWGYGWTSEEIEILEGETTVVDFVLEGWGGERIRHRRKLPVGEQIGKVPLVGFGSHPNPFNPETTISYELTDAAYVTLDVYNALGQRVASLVDQNQAAGLHQYQWNGSNHTSGVYFVQFRVNANVFTERLLLTK